MSRIALDSNILVYALGPNDDARCAQCQRLLGELRVLPDVYIPLQAVRESTAVLLRKKRVSGPAVQHAMDRLLQIFPVIRATVSSYHAGLRMLDAHQLSFWDSQLLATCEAKRIDILFSEDMQHGHRIGGVLILDPIHLDDPVAAAQRGYL